MRLDEFKFVKEQFTELERRVSALEQFVRGNKGKRCAECEADAVFTVGGSRTQAPGGWGVLSKDTSVTRCAACGHEEVV